MNFDVEAKKTKIRKKYSEVNELDIARISAAGPLFVLLLGIVSKIFGFGDFAVICVWLALLSIVPVGIGFKLLISSRLTWFFILIFSAAILLLMHVAGAFAVFFSAALFIALILLIYFLLHEQ